MSAILVPVDFSAVTAAVLATAARQARALGASIELIHVVPGEARGHHAPGSECWEATHAGAAGRPGAVQELGHRPEPARTVYVQADDDAAARQKQVQLRQREDELRAQGLSVTARLVSGKPAERILEEAGRLGVELIVMGSHGHGALHHLLLGSVSEGVLRKAPCAVVIVPAGRN